MYVFLATYSLRISFWVVPLRRSGDTPLSCATATYIANRVGAVELIVIEVLTLSRGISFNNARMSSSVLMATPTFPTSPCARGLSASSPS